MPLRCIDPTDDNRSIHAFDLDGDEWDALADRNRGDRFLRMPCCRAKVVLRRSHLGTQHFVHKVLPPHCLSDDETDHQFNLKVSAVESARRSGWEAETEVVGHTPDGERWLADVLARKEGERPIAIQIRWRSHTHDELRRGQRLFTASDVRCLWIVKGSPRLDDKDVPTVAAIVDRSDRYEVMLGDVKFMDPAAFLDAVFAGRFRFGYPGGRPPATGWKGKLPTRAWRVVPEPATRRRRRPHSRSVDRMQ